MEPQVIITALGFFVLGGGLGLLLGKRSTGDSSRLAELEESLVARRHEFELLMKDRERAVAEIAAAREELERSEARFGAFQGEVVDHFAGTSDLVRDLTLQYRSVISHLTDGVGKLCPEGSLEIADRMRLAALPTEATESEDDEGVIETSAVESEDSDGDASGAAANAAAGADEEANEKHAGA